MSVLAVRHIGSGDGNSSGPPVVALHGIRGHGNRWRFLTGLRVVAPDLRGHGRSTCRPPWSLEQHTDDLCTTLDQFGQRQWDVVGLSFGGAVALRFAVNHPERVRRLVLLDPATGLDPAMALDRARAALSVPRFRDPAEARRTRAEFWPAASDAVVDAEVAHHLRRDEDGYWRWRYEPAAVVTAFAEMSRPAPLPPSGVPTLLVHAARDSVLPARYVDDCAAAGVAVTRIDAGHGMDIEAPEATRRLVADFLSA